MTRVNVGVRARELPDRLLLAEHREIKRIPNAVRKLKGRRVVIPPKFVLGIGHVRFFYNKLGYLKCRYDEIYGECQRRGFRVVDYSDAWQGLSSGEYEEQPRDRELIVRRINSRGFSLLMEE